MQIIAGLEVGIHNLGKVVDYQEVEHQERVLVCKDKGRVDTVLVDIPVDMHAVDTHLQLVDNFEVFEHRK